MKFKTQKNLLVYIIPAAAALLARTLLLINWWDSPVRWYCNINGLDMQTILKLGTLFYEEKCVFSFYNMFLAIILFFNNNVHSVETIIIVQLLSGVVAAPLVAWCTLRLWKRKYWAVASGLLMALYAPAMMYESVVLKESLFLFFALLSLFAVLKAHKVHFSPFSLFLCGILLALMVTYRVSGLIFCCFASAWILANIFKKLQKNRKKIFIRISFLASGIALVLIPFFIVSLESFSSNNTYGKYLRNYIFSSRSSIESINVVNSKTSVEKNTKNTEVNNKINKAFSLLNNACKRIPPLFSASKIPNNVNYYFLKYKLFPLQYLVGPYLVIPLATVALLLLIFNGGILRKESILFVFIFSYMIPLCAFVPLARYRLVLIPVFCMLAPYPLFMAAKYLRAQKTLLASIPLFLWIMTAYINLPLNSFLRATDFASYGKGIQFQTGSSTEALPYFYQAYELAPWKQMTVINLADALLKCREPEKARAILIPAWQKSPDDLAYRYYLGIAYFFTREPEKAEKLFKSINPEDLGDLKPKYYFFYRQSLLAQKKYKAAAEISEKAGKTDDGK